MIVVVFEVWPAQGRKDDYLGIAAALRADLDRIDGFISIERFQSLSDPEKILSLSFWRDEEAVKSWRNQSKHRMRVRRKGGPAYSPTTGCGLPPYHVITA